MKAYLPIDIKFDDPTVVYSLNNSISSNVFNFYKFIHNLDVKTFLQDSILPCNCDGSDFIDNSYYRKIAIAYSYCWFAYHKNITNWRRYSLKALNAGEIIIFHGKRLKQASWRVSKIVLTHTVINVVLKNLS